MIDKRPLTDEEIISEITARTDDADSMLDTIRKEREQSLRYYNQEPFGDEQDGRSTFITSEVRDTIEWMLPQLLEMFIGGDNPVVFTPRNSDDIEAARQESEYVRYVATQQNDGFLNLYEWFKDALLTKNGFIKTYWNDEEVETKEEYENQSFAEFFELLNDDGLEIKEIIVSRNDDDKDGKSYTVKTLQKALEDGKVIAEDPSLVYAVKAVRSENLSQVEEYVVPPENMYVDRDLTSICLDEADFIREDMYLKESELREMGVSDEVIEKLPSENRSRLNDSESVERYSKEGYIYNNNTDKAGRLIKVSDVYCKIDTDGDGIAERRFIKIAGDVEVLENEEASYQPYTAITPNILTHKFYGMSIADMIADLQLLNSTLWRQTLDSLYLSNDPRKIVDINGGVNIEDLLTSRPGGIVRTSNVDSVRDLITPFVGQNTLPVIDKVGMMREERTGVSQTTQGLSPETLADSTNMVGAMIMNAAQQRIKMVARIFAEVGMKRRMMKIHELVLKHEKNEKIFDLNGEFVTVKPSTWRTRRDMSVKVGVGFNERKENIMSLERTINLQEKVFAAQQGEGPLLNVQNVYNAITDLQRLTGVQSPDRYFSNPQNYTPPPPEPDVTSETLDIAEAELTLNASDKAAQRAIERDRLRLDADKARIEAVNRSKELALKYTEIMAKSVNEEEKRKLDALFKAAEMIKNEVRDVEVQVNGQGNGVVTGSQEPQGQPSVQESI